MAADARALTDGRHDGPVSGIHQEIARARADLEVALADLETSARRVVSARHWRDVAEASFRRHPLVWLGGAAAFGFWLGYRPRRRDDD